MLNMPEIKMGIVAVSRDCFPMTLSESRRKAVAAAYNAKYGQVYECPIGGGKRDSYAAGFGRYQGRRLFRHSLALCHVMSTVV